MTAITEEAVLLELAKVHDPELHRDIVTLGMVKKIEIQERKVWVDIELTTPACPMKDKIKSDIEASLTPLGVELPVEINWSAQVASSNAPDDSRAPGIKNVLAVASGKGGVGKSSVAVNLAVALSQEGARVGLMDVDIYGPSIPHMTGTTGQTPEVKEGRLQPVSAHGLKMVSMGYLVPEGQAVAWRGPMLHKAITQFFEDVDWGEIDYLVVDMPPGTGDVQLSLSQIFPLTGAVMVTTPQPVALIDVERGASMFERVNVPLLGVIENMSYFVCSNCDERHEIFDHGGGKRAALRCGWPFLGEIPIDPTVREGGDNGIPVVLSHPDSAVARAFRETARTLAGKVSQAVFSGTD